MPFRRIYELNTRLWLAELSAIQTSPRSTLATIPEACIEQWQRWQIDAVWLMGVWEPSPHSAQVAQQHAEIVLGCQRALEDFTLDDCISSPYAVQNYTVSDRLGGLEALLHFRSRLQQVGIGLILDFVPNHTACEHPWVVEHPQYYVQGTVQDVTQTPRDFLPVQTVEGLRYIAHGRDPYFAPWADTAQLNYGNPHLHAAMQGELLRLAQWCDGVRCDMAMLCLSEVFSRTWGKFTAPPPQEFWAETIAAVHAQWPQFCFIAEVYWGLETRLQELGFTLCYDKELYDALLSSDAKKLNAYVRLPCSVMERRLRFLENHDEARAAAHFLETQEEAAALFLTALPGSSLLHEGQIEGARYHTPVQLRRRRQEPVNQRLQAFYTRLLTLPDICQGTLYPLQPSRAWADNWTAEAFVAWAWWQNTTGYLVVINYADVTSQCYLNLTALPLPSGKVILSDLLHDITYVRHHDELQQPGMYFDMPPYTTHLFTVRAEE